jgi:glutathione S-transferase
VVAYHRSFPLYQRNIARAMSEASLTIISRNYGSWSLRGWLLCEFAGLAVDVLTAAVGDDAARAELLVLSPSYLVPRLEHGDTIAWGVWAIAEHLHELDLPAATFPVEPARRAHCRSVCGEMLSGFANLRSALPMNIRAQHRGFNVWSGARADIDRIVAIWRDCLERYGGPYLFGSDPTAADAMYAPVCTRFTTYDVTLDADCGRYRDTVLAHPAMDEWIGGAHAETEQVEELDPEF